MDKKIKMHFVIALLFLIVCAILVDGCTKSLSINLTFLGWIIENIHPSFWSSPVTETCFYNFWLEYEGDDVTADDIEYARIYLQDGSYWSISTDRLNREYRYIGGWGRWYWSDEYHALPIGTLRAEIKLTNGHTTSYTQIIPAPGNTSTLGYTHIYTEDYSGPPASYVPMLKRATIGNKSKALDISIDFSVNDTTAYNGYVAFYDATETFIGTTAEYFKDWDTENINSIINLGVAFYNNGVTNTVAISDSDISYVDGYTYTAIAKFIVVLMDGGQYAGSQSYDCISRAEMTAF